MCSHRFELWERERTRERFISSVSIQPRSANTSSPWRQALRECAGAAEAYTRGRNRGLTHSNLVVYEADCSGLGSSFDPTRVCCHCHQHGGVEDSVVERCWLCEHVHSPSPPPPAYKDSDFQ